MADDFTRRRFIWLEQVASDPGISGSTCKLAIYIACRFLNRKTNTAWPSQPALAELLGIRTREGVRYCVDQLVAGGRGGWLLLLTSRRGVFQLRRLKMITSFEVGARFQILDEASPTLRLILKQVRELNVALDKARASLSSLGKSVERGTAAVKHFTARCDITAHPCANDFNTLGHGTH